MDLIISHLTHGQADAKRDLLVGFSKVHLRLELEVEHADKFAVHALHFSSCAEVSFDLTTDKLGLEANHCFCSGVRLTDFKLGVCVEAFAMAAGHAHHEPLWGKWVRRHEELELLPVVGADVGPCSLAVLFL